jgi:transcriptional antiterminator NusG
MNYYFIACRSGKEEKTRDHLSRLFSRVVDDEYAVQIYIPMRQMIDRRRGKKLFNNRPILPGYLLVASETDLTPYAQDVRSVASCYGFLHYVDKTISLKGGDREYASWIMHYKGTIKPSKAILKKGEPIKIIEGPLQDFFGTILKVDYRHSRALVEFEVADQVRRVSMPIEFIESEQALKDE